jgi:hypothetical protein
MGSPWVGCTVWGDNPAEFLKSPIITTKYLVSVNPNDNLFTDDETARPGNAPTHDNALFNYVCLGQLLTFFTPR